VKESAQATPSNQSWALSGLSLSLVVVTALWTYVAWLSDSHLLDLQRLQLFLTHHTDIFSSLLAFSVGLTSILLLHEAGHLVVGGEAIRGAPLWLPAPGLYIPSLGGFQRAQSPVNIPHPGRYALMGPLCGISGSAVCLILGTIILPETPYLLRIDTMSQAPLIQLLTLVGLGAELNGLQVAGWMGLLLSSFQLLPIGATDGGQIIRVVAPGLHLFISLTALCLFTLVAFTFPISQGFTWWAWAALSSLHIFGSPIITQETSPSLIRRSVLGLTWLLLFLGTLTVSLNAIPTAVIPEANISQEVEL